MQQPTLVIMAAGIGNRYGGLKQIDPVDEYGNLIIDYSLFDALQSGFKRVVCIINKNIEKSFNEVIGHRIAQRTQLVLVYQEINKLPPGYTVPKGRTKPWGTAHALWCSKELLDGPFAVINADDFYGKSAFSIIYNYLSAPRQRGEFAMVGYALENTLTDHGTVTRAVCDVNKDGYLAHIKERFDISKHYHGGVYEHDGQKTIIPKGTTVSMNFWGFDTSFLQALEDKYLTFLNNDMAADPLNSEYLLPNVVQDMLKEGKANVRVLNSRDKWFGVTYSEDMLTVRAALREKKAQGVYSEKLWS